MPSETVWIIVSKQGGSYVGHRSTRRAIIADHVNALDDVCYAAQNTFGLLTDDQRRVWAECQRKGDRAVRATLVWDEDSNG